MGFLYSFRFGFRFVQCSFGVLLGLLYFVALVLVVGVLR